MRKIVASPSVWLVVSAATIAASIIVIAIIRPVWGIDFTGGSIMEVPASRHSIAAITSALHDQFELDATIQPTSNESLLIRTTQLDDEAHGNIIRHLRDNELISGEELRFETIGPTIGEELRKKSINAFLFVLVALIAYLAWEFRSVKGLVASWKFGIAAAYALLHDLIVVTALFVILGKVWGAPIDTLFVTAQLAILGYSVNDTIIIFNRFKSEWLKDRSTPVLDLINKALAATISRSLNTSFTTIIVLVSLLVLGGSTIQWFVVALLAGTVAGTYSSLFVATPLLYRLAKR